MTFLLFLPDGGYRNYKGRKPLEQLEHEHVAQLWSRGSKGKPVSWLLEKKLPLVKIEYSVETPCLLPGAWLSVDTDNAICDLREKKCPQEGDLDPSPVNQLWNHPPPDLPSEAMNILVVERLLVGFPLL